MLLFLHQSKPAVRTTLIQHQTTRARDHLNGMAPLGPLLMVLLLSHQRRVHLLKAPRTTLLLEAKTRGMALHHKPMVVVVTTFHHGTRTGTKMVTTTTTTTKVMVAGAARSKGIKTGIFAEALVGEMEMHIHKEAPQHL